MFKHYFLPIFYLFLYLNPIQAELNGEFPVLYQGRFRPAIAYSQLWLYEMYHSPIIKGKDLHKFHSESTSGLNFLLKLNSLGNHEFTNSPLFWIGSSKIKNILELSLQQDRFSYQDLSNVINFEIPKNENKNIEEDLLSLKNKLKHFLKITKPSFEIEKQIKKRIYQLQKLKYNNKDIQKSIEEEFPLLTRLKQSGQLLQILPAKPPMMDWFPLNALFIQVYDSNSNQFKEIENFTAFSNENFQKIRQVSKDLTIAYQNDVEPLTLRTIENKFEETLLIAYAPLSNQIYQKAYGKTLHYPSLLQLKMEALYINFPWISILILLYCCSVLLFLASYKYPHTSLCRYGWILLVLAFICHSFLLLLRSYILMRPPVSNMFETVLYVPWVTAFITFFFSVFRKQTFVLIAAALSSIILLIILKITDLNQNLDQVQAVLDSQFWLTIHVLMVVGSYGVFILSGILGHFYLGLYIKNQKETALMKQIGEHILQSLYGGTTLLIIGTILGGIWAAESWGRFWDWDPKESWAFISSCFYLIWIHAYRFKRIKFFGLAIGSIVGLLAISFTWYGVNYILGTGLHSYGFGSGGEWGYYAFILIEIGIILISLIAS
ncbi:MAG: cytochrome c biogenesis protein CcsA, partial [Parachlamydiaceae bacterium]|nr:cytochrome c biogenesis protein CcsA [Parachlamydiaceae bacterium]